MAASQNHPPLGASHAVHFDQARRPQVLSDDLKPAELVEALSMLHFQNERPVLVSIDRHVRDYLVAALTARRGKA